MPKKICAICGAEFEARSNRAKYCSEPCKLKGHWKARDAWEIRTGFADRMRDYMREKRAKEKEERRNARIQGY